MPRRKAFLPKSGSQKIKLNVDSADDQMSRGAFHLKSYYWKLRGQCIQESKVLNVEKQGIEK